MGPDHATPTIKWDINKSVPNISNFARVYKINTLKNLRLQV